jgi:hypothetical protein
VEAAELVLSPVRGGERAVHMALELGPYGVEPKLDARYHDGRFELVVVDTTGSPQVVRHFAIQPL